MGLRMQGPKDCGEVSELDCRWHGLGNTHYREDSFWLLCGEWIGPGHVRRQGAQERICRSGISRGGEEHWAESGGISFTSWLSESRRGPNAPRASSQSKDSFSWGSVP